MSSAALRGLLRSIPGPLLSRVGRAAPVPAPPPAPRPMITLISQAESGNIVELKRWAKATIQEIEKRGKEDQENFAVVARQVAEYAAAVDNRQRKLDKAAVVILGGLSLLQFGLGVSLLYDC